MNEKILIIGANGQIGTALLPLLQQVYGDEEVIGTDIRRPQTEISIFELLDATKPSDLAHIITKHKITQIYHLAAILSATAEKNPLVSWDLNMQTLLNVLEAGRVFCLDKIFVPSSIAVFGQSALKQHTPQHSYLDPSTVYGISKVATENWANYYYLRYGLDVRSLRYPGVISYQSMPGGGTTDYAVEIFHKAVSGEPYTCFLSEDTMLPMIYIPDALRATLELMEADAERLRIRTSYNIAGLSFTPKEVASAIKKEMPEFTVTFAPDFRQQIAESWPQSIDDSQALKDWNWKPKYDLAAMTHDMLVQLAHQAVEK
ncbi:Nucleoside-diphosphate-sugar epimerase [bacterium A37T11]|nr:Nucleoside-diphosphate-sugar epimerase [bacterium A37T11]